MRKIIKTKRQRNKNNSLTIPGISVILNKNRNGNEIEVAFFISTLPDVQDRGRQRKGKDAERI